MGTGAPFGEREVPTMTVLSSTRRIRFGWPVRRDHLTDEAEQVTSDVWPVQIKEPRSVACNARQDGADDVEVDGRE